MLSSACPRIYHTISSSGVILISWPSRPAFEEGVQQTLGFSCTHSLAILFLVQGNVHLVFWNQLALSGFLFFFFFPFKMWSVTVPCLEQKGCTKTSWLEVKICMLNKLSRWFFCTFKFCNICTCYFILSRRLKLSDMNLLNLGFPLLLHPHFPFSLHLLKCLPFFSRVKCYLLHT